jgi:hypothetical protein
MDQAFKYPSAEVCRVGPHYMGSVIKNVIYNLLGLDLESSFNKGPINIREEEADLGLDTNSVLSAPMSFLRLRRTNIPTN